MDDMKLASELVRLAKELTAVDQYHKEILDEMLVPIRKKVGKFADRKHLETSISPRAISIHFSLGVGWKNDSGPKWTFSAVLRYELDPESGIWDGEFRIKNKNGAITDHSDVDTYEGDVGRYFEKYMRILRNHATPGRGVLMPGSVDTTLKWF